MKDSEAPIHGPLVIEEASDSSVVFSLVIPTYNESSNLPKLVAAVSTVLSSIWDNRYEIIVVDDNSPDRTWEVGLALQQEFTRLRIIRRQHESGLSTAVIRGWQMAKGSILGVIDGDLQHPPEVLLDLLTQMADGADLAVATRNVEGGGVSDWSFSRRILSRGAQLIGLLFLPEVFDRLTDPMSGFFMLKRSTIAGVKLDPIGYKVLLEVLGRGKIRWVAEVPYTFRERQKGESKVRLGLYFEYIAHLFRLRIAGAQKWPIQRYFLVGVLGVMLDMLLLYCLSEEHMLGLGIGRSKLLAAQPVILVTLVANEFWSFAKTPRPRGATQVFRRFLVYFVISWVALFGATTVLSGLVEFAGINRYLANALGIAVMASWSYRLHRKITWCVSSYDLEQTEKKEKLELLRNKFRD